MRVGVLTALAFGAMACNGDTGAGPSLRSAEVTATSRLRFEPDTVSIARGGAVTWTFGAVPHNVVFEPVAGRPQDIAGQNTNVSVPRTFTEAGIYRYTCTIHPGMVGSVTVLLPKPDALEYLVSP